MGDNLGPKGLSSGSSLHVSSSKYPKSVVQPAPPLTTLQQLRLATAERANILLLKRAANPDYWHRVRMKGRSSVH